MSVPTRLCIALFASALVSWGAAGQQANPSTLRSRQTAPPPRTISLDVVVTHKSGDAVSGLEEKDFTILDNKTPQTITSFHAYEGSKEPIEVILLIDSINTSFQIVAQERDGIEKFLRSNEGRLAHPLTLAVLTNDGVQMQGAYTLDGNILATSLDKYTIGLRTIGPSTGAEGAAERLQDSLKALRMLASYEMNRPGRKLILWVSPGWPLLSGPRVDLTYKQQGGIFNEITWLSTQLRQEETTIYSLNPMGVAENPAETFYYQQFLNGVSRPEEDAMGNLALQVIATETGGLVLDSSDVAALLKQCMGDAGAYYRISFEPPASEHRDVYHRLQIKLTEPGLTARTSTGYYGEP